MRGFTLRALFALLPLGVGCRDDRDGPLLGPVDLSGLDPGFETYTGSDSALIFENGYVARIVASNAVVHGGATGAGYDLPSRAALARLARRIWACRRCPRLAAYLDRARQRWPDHACRPVPGWGDPRARLIIVGLAPGLHGAGRTGRMFTFDSSGAWLYGTLHRFGWASRPVSRAPGDGLRLRGVYITAAARCAPPANRPLPQELSACRPYLAEELRLLRSARVILALGRIAHEAVLRVLGVPLRQAPFGHGAERVLPDGRILLSSYHPSRRNTQTGLLTPSLWEAIFRRARMLLRTRPPRRLARRRRARPDASAREVSPGLPER